MSMLMIYNLFLASFVDIDIFYIFLNILLLCTFVIAGINVSNGESYWKNACICIFVFVLIVGTRYNRGIDYVHYVEVYQKNIDIDQPLFSYFNTFLKEYIGISKYFIFYIYAIPFIYSAFVFLQNYKKYSLWLFPFFLVSLQFFEEEFIRQAFGFSFVFLLINEIVNNFGVYHKVLLSCLYIFLIINIHSANILFVALFVFFFYWPRRVVPYYVSIPILIFASYFFVRLYDLSYLKPILTFLGSTNGKFHNYVNDDYIENWFGEGAMQLGNARNPLILILEIIANASLFYFSYKCIYKNRKKKDIALISITNLYIIGYITRNAFLYFELINRVASLFQRMWFLPCAVIITKVRFNKLNTIEKLAFFSLVFLLYDYVKYLFAPRPGMTLFLWDLIL